MEYSVEQTKIFGFIIFGFAFGQRAMFGSFLQSFLFYFNFSHFLLSIYEKSTKIQSFNWSKFQEKDICNSKITNIIPNTDYSIIKFCVLLCLFPCTQSHSSDINCWNCTTKWQKHRYTQKCTIEVNEWNPMDNNGKYGEVKQMAYVRHAYAWTSIYSFIVGFT